MCQCGNSRQWTTPKDKHNANCRQPQLWQVSVTRQSCYLLLGRQIPLSNQNMASSNVETTAPWVGKSYRMVSSSNFEDFLKAKGMDINSVQMENLLYNPDPGVGLIGRKMANSVTPTVALSVDDAGIVYTFHTYSTFKNSSYAFTLDEEFDEETPDGRTVRSIISLLDGGRRMLHRQLGDRPTVIERTFTETEAHVVSLCTLVE